MRDSWIFYVNMHLSNWKKTTFEVNQKVFLVSCEPRVADFNSSLSEIFALSKLRVFDDYKEKNFKYLYIKS